MQQLSRDCLVSIDVVDYLIKSCARKLEYDYYVSV